MSDKAKFFFDLKTAPSDKRFPSQNQANHCWNRYNEWLLCLKGTNGDRAACSNVYSLTCTICPSEWIEAWDEQREEGTFPGIQYTE